MHTEIPSWLFSAEIMTCRTWSVYLNYLSNLDLEHLEVEVITLFLDVDRSNTFIH